MCATTLRIGYDRLVSVAKLYFVICQNEFCRLRDDSFLSFDSFHTPANIF